MGNITEHPSCCLLCDDVAQGKADPSLVVGHFACNGYERSWWIKNGYRVLFHGYVDNQWIVKVQKIGE